MIAVALAPVMAWWLGLEAVVIGGILILVLLLLSAHRENLLSERLPRNREPGSALK
jgi:hypothetical protein